jgi:hypothetical protein
MAEFPRDIEEVCPTPSLTTHQPDSMLTGYMHRIPA